MLEGMFAHNVPCPVKFTALIDESVKKVSQFPANTVILKSY